MLRMQSQFDLLDCIVNFHFPVTIAFGLLILFCLDIWCSKDYSCNNLNVKRLAPVLQQLPIRAISRIFARHSRLLAQSRYFAQKFARKIHAHVFRNRIISRVIAIFSHTNLMQSVKSRVNFTRNLRDFQLVYCCILRVDVNFIFLFRCRYDNIWSPTMQLITKNFIFSERNEFNFSHISSYLWRN